ncbi:MAG: ATP-binding cassette domain-containing protein [Arachnia propionica]|uniref:ABC transporter ATP-binding protein n=1 Tax=Arachnia propionica TaxID=1750 RepID=UPI002707E25C|nr:ATP-binding cassette domain-containing protein [Arachnia propionica]
MAERLLEIRGVTQRFRTSSREVVAVSEVSVEVDAGSVTCLVGESGSGKTTLARIAAGLDRPTAGSIHHRGRDISTLRGADLLGFRRRVQYVHQDPYASLNPTRTVFSTLRSALGARSRRTRQHAAGLLERVELTPVDLFLDRHPHQLSGGQRQRVALARALATEPELIIADETTSMLDASIRGSMINLLAELRDDLGVGFLFITHDFTLARHFAWHGRTAVLRLGRLVEYGPTPEVMDSPSHAYTRALIDALPMIRFEDEPNRGGS